MGGPASDIKRDGKQSRERSSQSKVGAVGEIGGTRDQLGSRSAWVKVSLTYEIVAAT